ncbi:MAG: hypothetical protein WD069_09655 [Planctomycetales bacterium]
MSRPWHRVTIIVVAAPVFLVFPLAMGGLAMAGQQLIWGFDDMPIWSMLLGMLLGGVIAAGGLALVCIFASRGSLLAAVVITVVAAAVDCACIPIGRWVTARVEGRVANPAMGLLLTIEDQLPEVADRLRKSIAKVDGP